jgi:hypothetical protein
MGGDVEGTMGLVSRSISVAILVKKEVTFVSGLDRHASLFHGERDFE